MADLAEQGFLLVDRSQVYPCPGGTRLALHYKGLGGKSVSQLTQTIMQIVFFLLFNSFQGVCSLLLPMLLNYYFRMVTETLYKQPYCITI